MGFFDEDPELTDFQKKQIISFVDDVNALNISVSNENIFLKEFMQKINTLDIFHDYESPVGGWFSFPFYKFSQEMKEETLTIIEPIMPLAKKYLETITDYNGLIAHIKDIDDFRNRYAKEKKKGIDIHMSYDFFDKYSLKIGRQWHDVGELICDFELLKLKQL